MNIVDVIIHKLIVPVDLDKVHSPGIQDPLCAPDPITGRVMNFHEFPKWIIELVADNGLIGLGEPRRGDLYEPLKKYADMIIGKTLAELPVGNLPLPHGDVYESYIIYEAYEMAWLDMLGKHLGVPVHHLLGGKMIDRIPCDYWMGRGDAEETAKRVKKGVDLGFTGFKMKCRPGDPSTPAERVEAAKDVAPTIPLVLDFNDSLPTLADAVKVGKSLEKFNNVMLESPMPQGRLDWYVLLRSKIAVPIALHLTSFGQLLPALRMDACDYYNLLGPLREFTEWAKLTRAAGCPTWRGTGGDLGVRDMSSVHCAAAAGCELHCDILGSSFLREDDLIVDGIEYEQGAAVVPDKPGLGVELDRKALEKYRVD